MFDGLILNTDGAKGLTLKDIWLLVVLKKKKAVGATCFKFLGRRSDSVREILQEFRS